MCLIPRGSSLTARETTLLLREITLVFRVRYLVLRVMALIILEKFIVLRTFPQHDSIDTVRDSFNTGNRDQNLLESDRPEISQGRVIINNDLYKITDRVVKAAKSIYKTNPAKLGQYIYNPPVKHRVPEEGLVFEGTLNASEIANINLENLQLATTDIVLMEGMGSTFNFFSAAASDNGQAGAAILDTEGAPQQRTVGDLINEIGISDLKPYFNTQNTGMLTGIYKVTITRGS